MELIIIRGRQNDGKTMTATMLHNELVAHCNAVRLLKTNGDYLSIGNDIRDFRSVIDIDKKRIAIISEGDEADVLNKKMEELIYDFRPDVMVVCARAYNREGSSYRMLEENYGEHFKDENVFWTEKAEDFADALNAKRSVVNKIVKQIMNI